MRVELPDRSEQSGDGTLVKGAHASPEDIKI